MATKKSGPTKIIKMEKAEKQEAIKIEFTPEELELKSKLDNIDNKAKSLLNVLSSIIDSNEDSIFIEDTLVNMVGLSAMTAATNVIGEYFGLEKMSLDNFL